MNSRKGLKRYGMRSYIVRGPKAAVIIERELPSRYAIRREEMPPQFFMQKFRRLGKAREAAEGIAGL